MSELQVLIPQNLYCAMVEYYLVKHYPIYAIPDLRNFKDFKERHGNFLKDA
jgi:hypothetical protein